MSPDDLLPPERRTAGVGFDGPPLYHIASADQARAGALTGTYAPEAFEAEGFIHCSYLHQIVAVANRLFAGRPDLVLLEIDRAGLSCEVVDENLEGGIERFPHVYGRLPMNAVLGIFEFPCGADGRFDLPHPLTTLHFDKPLGGEPDSWEPR